MYGKLGDMDKDYMCEIVIKEILIPSLQDLYWIDYENIINEVSERNICARLSLHVENRMRGYDAEKKSCIFTWYYADVEYNRMGKGEKKKYENSEHRPQYMVSDLLIQSRGYQENLLAVEMKRKGNYRHVEEDKKRLMSLVSSSTSESPSRCVHDTLVGAFIVYSKDWVKIDIYENINGKGILTRAIEFECYDMTQLRWRKYQRRTSDGLFTQEKTWSLNRTSKKNICSCSNE